MLKNSAPIEDARLFVADCGHSRIPVYGENRDDVVGVLYAKDLLPRFESSGVATVGELKLRRPVYVPETKPADVLLREFRKERIHIAIVLDEYGGVAGVVTIEDVLEQIVGDIVDEYDEEDYPVSRISENILVVDARMRVDQINQMLRLELPEDEDYDTIGGFVFSKLERIPKVGEFFEESFQDRRTRFTVLDANDRAIKRLQIERVLPKSENNIETRPESKPDTKSEEPVPQEGAEEPGE
jgi:CBS domain containing-hemolysin-like protein